MTGTYYLGRLHTVSIPGTEFVRVEQKWGDEFMWVVHDRYLVLIPDRMKTDFGSIPKRLRMLVSTTKYKEEYAGHDDLYHYGIVFIPRSGAFGPEEFACAREACHELDEMKRMAILGERFDLLVLRNHLTADLFLDAMIKFMSKGDARGDRALIFFGLFLGGGVTWRYKQRIREEEKRAKHLRI